MRSKDCAYVDTSALIPRIFASKEIRNKLNENFKKYEGCLVTSSYVVGEFKRTIVRDLIFLRNLIFDYGIEEALKRLSRLPRTRRISNIISILGNIILAFREYFSILDAIDVLRVRAPLQCFHGISIVEDSTNCLHSNITEVNLPDGHVSVSFRCKGCGIVDFVKNHEVIVNKIKDEVVDNISCSSGFRKILSYERVSYYCKRVSDCIISIVASELCRKIISCNPQDFGKLSSTLGLEHINGCR